MLQLSLTKCDKVIVEIIYHTDVCKYAITILPKASMYNHASTSHNGTPNSRNTDNTKPDRFSENTYVSSIYMLERAERVQTIECT